MRETFLKLRDSDPFSTMTAYKDLQKEVKSLRNEVSTGKGIVKVLVFLGTITATIIGFFQFR